MNLTLEQIKKNVNDYASETADYITRELANRQAIKHEDSGALHLDTYGQVRDLKSGLLVAPMNSSFLSPIAEWPQTKELMKQKADKLINELDMIIDAFQPQALMLVDGVLQDVNVSSGGIEYRIRADVFPLFEPEKE